MLRIYLLTLLLINISDGRNSVFAEDMQLRMLDGTSRPATFVDLGRDTLSIHDNQGAEQSVPLAELKAISFDRKLEQNTERKTVIQFTNGDLLLVETISMIEDALVVKIGDDNITIPLEFVRNVFFETTVFQLTEPSNETQGNDTVVLKNGDVVRGELLLLKDSEVEVSTELGKLKFPQPQVQSITFDSELSAQVPVTDSFVQFILKNGSVLTASYWEYNSNLKQFDLGLFESNHLKVRLDELSRIEFWNSNILPLSQLTPIRFSSEDFFGNQQPFEANRSLSKQTLLCGQSLYTSGFAVRSRSKIVFKVSSNASAFVASLGFDDRIKKSGAVDVRVVVDGKVVWEDSLTRQQKSFVEISNLPVQPHQELELQVDFGKQADIGDNLIWCQPYFVLQK